MKKYPTLWKNFLAVGLVLFAFTSCKDDDTPLSPSEVRLTEGFVFTAFTPNNNIIVEYFPTLPSGTANMSAGLTLEGFAPSSVFNGALYGRSRDNGQSIVKYGINGNEELVDDGEISTQGAFPFNVRVIDETIGVFDGRGTTAELNFFNPETFEVIGSVDITDPAFPEVQRSQDMTRRGDILFTVARPNGGTNFDKTYVQATNYVTGQYLGVTSFDVGNRFVTPLGINTSSTFADFGFFGFQNVDEQGNVYVLANSDPINRNPLAGILKIPAGSTQFDPNYFFTPALVADPTNQFFATMNNAFRYIGNGKALACVAIGTPPELIQFITDIGGPQNLTTPELINQATAILFQAENARWSVLDLNTQSVTLIDGVPSQSPVVGAYIVEVDGSFYFSVQNEETNAYYVFDGGTSATKAFDFEGGSVNRFYNLGANN